MGKYKQLFEVRVFFLIESVSRLHFWIQYVAENQVSSEF